MTTQELRFVSMIVNKLAIFHVPFKMIPNSGMPSAHIMGTRTNILTKKEDPFRIIFSPNNYVIELLDSTSTRVLSRIPCNDTKGIMIFLDCIFMRGD